VAFHAGPNHGLLWLVVLALFGSFVSLYYYLSVLKVIFVDKGVDKSAVSGFASNALPQSIAAILAAAVLVLGILPETLVAVIARSVP